MNTDCVATTDLGLASFAISKFKTPVIDTHLHINQIAFRLDCSKTKFAEICRDWNGSATCNGRELSFELKRLKGLIHHAKKNSGRLS